jgi:hypothetical protein
VASLSKQLLRGLEAFLLVIVSNAEFFIPSFSYFWLAVVIFDNSANFSDDAANRIERGGL